MDFFISAYIPFSFLFQDLHTGHKILESLVHVFDHLPFLASAVFFRVCSITLLLTYLNNYWGFVTIGVGFVCSVLLGYKRLE